MDDSLKDVLTKHWWLLVRYIVPSEELIRRLEEGGVIPSTMIDDIRMASSKKDKNEKLLFALKLRGNTAYRNFRDIVMKCGQIFIADLLFEEDKDQPPLVEESDFLAVPNMKLNLSPDDVKRVASFLDAKVKYRVLKSEWKTNSAERFNSLQQKHENSKNACSQNDDPSQSTKVAELRAEIKSKNDLLRAMSLEVNTLNHDIANFLKRHKVLGANHVTTKISHEAPPSEEKKTRFRQFEIYLDISIQRLSNLLGESANTGGTLEDLNNKTKQIQALVRELESKLYVAGQDRHEALGLLGVDHTSTLAGVRTHIEADKKDRMSLLKAIDQLSRRLRSMNTAEPHSGLRALRQSAVTGKPSPEMVDYRFLMNHIALLEADAEHIAKRLSWKDVEVKALRTEVMTLRRRYGCVDSSPDFTPTQVELGD